MFELRRISQFWAALIPLGLGPAAMAQSPAERSQPQQPYPTFGSVARWDPRLDELIPPDAKLEKLAQGFEWSEGPVWVRDGGYLLFSDIPRNTIFKWQEGQGIDLYMKPSGYTGVKPRGREPGSNGLVIDASGRLVLCEHGDRRVARVEKDGGKITLVDRYEDRRLNSPNDAVYHTSGDLYFTDPPYGFPKQWDDEHRELDFCGVFRLGTDGRLTLLARHVTRPNGIAFAPDEKTLYVSQSDGDAPIWWTFNVAADGTLDQGRTFADARKLKTFGQPGGPDGLKVDRHGNLFATGPGGVIVFAPDATPLGAILTGERTANCNWGDDGSVLYITADMYLARIKTSTSGAGWIPREEKDP